MIWPCQPALTLAKRGVQAAFSFHCFARFDRAPYLHNPPCSRDPRRRLGAALLARVGLAPWSVPLAFLLLLVRTGFMLGPLAPDVAATKVGIAESILGGALVIVFAFSWM
jgi:hypothetical protein